MLATEVVLPRTALTLAASLTESSATLTLHALATGTPLTVPQALIDGTRTLPGANGPVKPFPFLSKNPATKAPCLRNVNGNVGSARTLDALSCFVSRYAGPAFKSN